MSQKKMSPKKIIQTNATSASPPLVTNASLPPVTNASPPLVTSASPPLVTNASLPPVTNASLSPFHTSVLLTETLEIFADQKISVFVDGTLGAGGHAAAILTAHPEIQKFIGIDQDPDAMELARKKLEPWKDKVIFVAGNFSDLNQHLKDLGIDKVDAILLDIGVSSMQIDRPEKGFSFAKDGPLDMRMDPTSDLTAADVVNNWSEKELARIFHEYGEERRSRPAARAIVQARAIQPIETTAQLVKVLSSSIGRGKPGIHPATLIFQALRICVNRELDRLSEVIPIAIKMLAKQGRLAIISFHSLEDRIVKQAFRYAADDKVNTSGIAGTFLSKNREVIVLTKKPLIADIAEIKQNPRSRSAKLRAIEKL